MSTHSHSSPTKKTRAEAARENGAKSRGPTTPEGKAKSSRNSMKHGFCSRTIVLQTENPDAFYEMLENTQEYFVPEDRMEQELVLEMATARWQLRRIWSLRTALIDIQSAKMHDEILRKYPEADVICKQAMAFQQLTGASPSLDATFRYEAQHSRSFDRALRNLEKLRRFPRLAPALLPEKPNSRKNSSKLQNEPSEPAAPPSQSIPPEPPEQPSRTLTYTLTGITLPLALCLLLTVLLFQLPAAPFSILRNEPGMVFRPPCRQHLAVRGGSPERPLTARGSVEPARYRAATVRERVLPRTASPLGLEFSMGGP